MATPKSVEKQEQESEQAIDAFMQSQGASDEVTPDSQLEASREEPAPKQKEEKQEQTQVETPAAPDGELEQLKKQIEYERHRNDSLQGRLESQLRPMNDTVRDLRSKVSELESALTQRKEAERAAENSVPAYLRHVLPNEVESLGKEVVDVQSRIARGVTEAAVQTSEARMEDRRKEMEKRLDVLESERQAAAGNSFWDAIEGKFPGAKKINQSDARWGEFLNSVDPLSGRSRRELGEVATGIGDVRRVVSLLAEFKESLGERSAAAQVKPEVVRADANPLTQRTQQSARKMLIKESQIKKFYDDWGARGKFRGREAEAEKIAAAIEAAVDEGRIIRG